MHSHVIYPTPANMHSKIVQHALWTKVKRDGNAVCVRTTCKHWHIITWFSIILLIVFYSKSSSHFIHSFIRSFAVATATAIDNVAVVVVVVTFHLYGFSDPIQFNSTSLSLWMLLLWCSMWYRHICTRCSHTVVLRLCIIMCIIILKIENKPFCLWIGTKAFFVMCAFNAATQTTLYMSRNEWTAKHQNECEWRGKKERKIECVKNRVLYSLVKSKNIYKRKRANIKIAKGKREREREGSNAQR